MIRGLRRLCVLAVLVVPSTAAAVEIRALTAQVIEIILRDLGPEFERATGHRIDLTVDLAVNFKRQIDRGAPFDVALFSELTTAELVRESKLRADTHTRILGAGIGVAVRRGAPKPDISSVEAFKRALLDARSVAYLKEGPSGVYLAGLLERLGIAEQVRAKATLADTDRVSLMIASGEAELGVVVIPNILNVPGAELVGPLPPEIQSTIYFAGGVSATAKQPEAARQLIQFLKSPRAREVIRARHMSPE